MSIYGTPVTASKNNTYFPGENISITNNKISTKAFPCNPNLLDNWYFGNPVNQRGASYVENNYGLDRWKGTYGVDANGTMGFNSSGFAIQGLEDSVKNILNGMTLTASILYANGTLIAGTAVYTKTGNAHNFIHIGSIQFNNQEDGNILLYAKSANQIKAVKLELGSQQTLAHQENGAWVLNEIPDYGEQLRRCQRYCFAWEYGAQKTACLAVMQCVQPGLLFGLIPTPVTMRATPVVTGVSLTTFAGRVTLLDNLITCANGIRAVAHIEGTSTSQGQAVGIENADDNSRVIFSADL